MVETNAVLAVTERHTVKEAVAIIRRGGWRSGMGIRLHPARIGPDDKTALVQCVHGVWLQVFLSEFASAETTTPDGARVVVMRHADWVRRMKLGVSNAVQALMSEVDVLCEDPR